MGCVGGENELTWLKWPMLLGGVPDEADTRKSLNNATVCSWTTSIIGNILK